MPILQGFSHFHTWEINTVSTTNAPYKKEKNIGGGLWIFS